MFIARLRRGGRKAPKFSWHKRCEYALTAACDALLNREGVIAMDEPVFAIVGNDNDAPRRFFDTFRRSEYLEPEKALLLALLEDAIHLYQKYRSARDRAGK